MKLSISEILEKASKIENEQERVFFLRQNDSTTLRSVFQGAYDPRIVWALPEGDPPYKPNNLVDQQHRLYTETRKFYLFIEGGNPNLKPLRREQLFVEFLETLDPQDAKLVLSMKNKKLPYLNITSQFVRQVFPGLLPE
jgi:hypothetical protein